MEQFVRALPLGDNAFGVEVHEGDLVTNHRVTVDDELLTEVGGADPKRVVEQSVAYLLEQEKSTSIPDDINLWEIQDQYPGYLDDLRARLS
jgi:hypothetical protein